MNAPYQRIKVPTAEQWNSAGKGNLHQVQATPPQTSSETRFHALVDQPIRPLIVQAPSAQPLNAGPTGLPKNFVRMKRLLVAGLALVLLVTAVSVFAADASVKGAQQAASTELTSKNFPSTALEPHVMNLPNTNQSATSSSERGTRSGPVKSHTPHPTNADRVETTVKEGAAIGATVKAKTALNGQELNQPVLPSTEGMVSNQTGTQAHATPAPANLASAPDVGTGTKTSAQIVTTDDGPAEVDTRTLALIALGVAGVGTVASIGMAMTAKRPTPEVDKFRCEDLTPAPTPSAKPAPTTTSTNSHGTRGASALAYIDQKDWAAALERTYGINTRPGPLNALVSVVGSRNANEDYACAYDLSDSKTGSTLHCMFVADGCGGHSAGREASCLAIRASSEAVLQAIKLSPAERVQAAFTAASSALISAGRQWDANSLRTTLIVVLADESHYYCGWIGDGGIDLHRANDQWESLLKPHKSGAQNLLAASLGPDQVGQPSFVTHARLPGDRIYIGSDGVFDVYSDPAAFWGSWFENASLTKAPQTCLAELLAKCAEHAAFDDNMTVAYLYTPAQRRVVSAPKPVVSALGFAYGSGGPGQQAA